MFVEVAPDVTLNHVLEGQIFLRPVSIEVIHVGEGEEGSAGISNLNVQLPGVSPCVAGKLAEY